MWDLDHKEAWMSKNWCFQTVVLENTLGSPLDCKEITPINSKGNQSWIFIESTDAEAEAPILWPPDTKSWLTEKDPDEGRRRRVATEDEMVGWYDQLNRHELEQIQGVSEGQGNLACCSSRGRKVRHNWVTEQQQNTCLHLRVLESSNLLCMHYIL